MRFIVALREIAALIERPGRVLTKKAAATIPATNISNSFVPPLAFLRAGRVCKLN
jgi:hypothetical protein